MEFILITTFFYLFGGALGAYPPHLPIGHGTIGRLYTALNTSEPVWMLKRSYTNENHRCVYSIKRSLVQFEYEFLQYYEDSIGMHGDHLYATLGFATGHKEGPKLTVRRTKDAEGGIDYILLHWDEESKCGILYFEDPREDNTKRAKCEAHIWNQKVTDGESKCLYFYEKYCKEFNRNEQTVYNNKCSIHPGC